MQQYPLEVDHHGQMIRGTVYRPASQQRAPAVLLLHGFTGQRTESGFLFVQLARALAQAGIAAVTFDFRNSGESDGSFEHMLVSGELDDALHMTQWLASRPFVDRSRMGLLGFSLGGLLAACAVARTPQYRALALLAPTTPQNLARISGKAGPDGLIVIGPHTLHAHFIEDLMRHDPVGDVTRNPRPTLLVQGTEDKAVPPAVSAPFAAALAAAGVPIQTKLIQDAEHVFATPGQRRELIASVVAFFAETL